LINDRDQPGGLMNAKSTSRIGGATALVLLTSAAIGLVAARCGGDSSPGPTPGASGSHMPATPVKAAQAPGGGGLRVVESGVSMVSNSLGETMATYGILLENTSRTQVAFDAQVVITMLDAAGRLVTDTFENSDRVTDNLRFALPGQRVGLGRYTYVPRGRTVASVRVEFGDAWWLPPADVRIAPLTTSRVTTSVTQILIRGRYRPEVRVDFTVDNGYPIAVNRTPVALLRNAAGTIVGGTGPEEKAESVFGHFTPGRSKGEIRSIGSPPPGMDLTRTEVYVYPTPVAYRIQ
jgi:hypothetical protein